MTDYPIDGYAFRMWSMRPTTNLNPGVAVAGVYYYQGTQYRGYVYFYPDGTPLADPSHDATNGRVYLSFNLSQLPAVLDVLRNEKPLVVYYESATNAALRSGVEPVGEEEGTGKP